VTSWRTHVAVLAWYLLYTRSTDLIYCYWDRILTQVFVWFVDIGGIVDKHSSNYFLFITTI